MALAFFFPHRQLPCFQGRSCSAGIWSPHWCGCAQWLTSSPTGPKGGRGVTWAARLNGWEILYIASLICLVDAWDWQLAHGNMLISLEDHSEARMLCSLWSLNFRGFTTSLPDLWNWSPVWCERHLLEIQWGIWPCLRRQKAPRVKVWRKRGGWILTAFCMTFWYSNAIQTTYYCIYLEGMTVACIQSPTHIHQKWYLHSAIHACWLVEYCVSPPGVFNVRWALTRCFVQPRFWDIRCFTMWQFVSLFSSKLYIMSVVDGNPCFFVGSLCNCFILERLEHAFLNVWLSTCRNHHKLGRV